MYPQQVNIEGETLRKFTAILKDSYTQITKEMAGASNFGVANRKAILSQIEEILKSTGEDVQGFLEDELPAYYKVGADEAVKQLRNVDAPIPVKTGFNRIHKEAVAALVDDASRAFGESMSGVSRSANKLLGKATRDLITQKMAQGTIGGKALREVKTNIVGIMQQDGLAALIDKGGRAWQLDDYAEMLFRTKVVEARNRGLANRMVENEYDLVQVSSHGADDVCGDWEGKILSLTGDTPGYDTVADAEADGLFHPNCRHAINVLIPSLADKTQAYDPDVDTLSPEDAGI